MLYKDLQILYSHNKRKLSNRNLERNCSHRIMFLFRHLKWANYTLGLCFVFLTRGQSFVLKSCPQDRDFDGKIVARESARGGGVMVTGQIDTCISFAFLLNLPTYQSDCVFLCTVTALNYANFKSTFQNSLE